VSVPSIEKPTPSPFAKATTGSSKLNPITSFMNARINSLTIIQQLPVRLFKPFIYQIQSFQLVHNQQNVP
jgi:hypothetical protein